MYGRLIVPGHAPGLSEIQTQLGGPVPEEPGLARLGSAAARAVVHCKAVHLAVDSGSDGRFAVGRCGPGHPRPDVARAGGKLRAVAVWQPSRSAVS